ncbi:MAG: endonuclease V [Ignisphaera sp.]
MEQVLIVYSINSWCNFTKIGILDFNISRAKSLQEHLSTFVRIEPLTLEAVEIIVGVDVGYRESIGVSVAVAYSVKRNREVCHTAVISDVAVPYIPGLLAFREAPIMIAAIKELIHKCTDFDIVMVNGHGITHPRKFGIASHIGVALEKPSIGVARSILYGDIVIVENKKIIVVDGIKAGYIIETGWSGEIYISVGHRITPDEALTVVEATWNKELPLPNPLYMADSLTKKYRKYIKR